MAETSSSHNQLTAPASHSHHSPLGSSHQGVSGKNSFQKFPLSNSADEVGNVVQIRLLEDASLNLRQKPKWMKYYGVISYIIYATISIYSWFYISYVGIYQAHPYMQIQYVNVVRYLEYNSYSILSPLLCSVFMGMLAYLVKKKIALEEGDFFGILGVFLFLALMGFHDGYGLYHQVQYTRDYNPKTPELDPPPVSNASRNDLAWQYAWSTKPSCAKKWVRQIIYQHEYDNKHLKKEIMMESDEDQGRQLQVNNAQRSTSLSKCNLYHEGKQEARIRKWMKDLQRENNCCGPYGYPNWTQWFADETRTGCDLTKKNANGKIRGCYDPLIKWLNEILWSTFWVMMVQGFLYIIAMITALVHHRAMKYEHYQELKAHSLLNVAENPAISDRWWRGTRPEYKPVVVGTNLVNETEHEGVVKSSSAIGAMKTDSHRIHHPHHSHHPHRPHPYEHKKLSRHSLRSKTHSKKNLKFKT